MRSALAVEGAEKAGARPEVRHISNTAAVLTLPAARFDLVRPGGAVYGLSTLPGGPPPELRPAMTLRTRLAQVKRVAPGTGVSYGHRLRDGHGGDARPATARVRGRCAAHRGRPGPRAGAGAALEGRGHGMHGSVRRRLRLAGLRRPETRSSCSARVMRVSRPPRSGQTRSARSRTRSSLPSETASRAFTLE